MPHIDGFCSIAINNITAKVKSGYVFGFFYKNDPGLRIMGEKLVFKGMVNVLDAMIKHNSDSKTQFLFFKTEDTLKGAEKLSKVARTLISNADL